MVYTDAYISHHCKHNKKPTPKKLNILWQHSDGNEVFLKWRHTNPFASTLIQCNNTCFLYFTFLTPYSWRCVAGTLYISDHDHVSEHVRYSNSNNFHTLFSFSFFLSCIQLFKLLSCTQLFKLRKVVHPSSKTWWLKTEGTHLHH